MLRSEDYRSREGSEEARTVSKVRSGSKKQIRNRSSSSPPPLVNPGSISSNKRVIQRDSAKGRPSITDMQASINDLLRENSTNLNSLAGDMRQSFLAPPPPPSSLLDGQSNGILMSPPTWSEGKKLARIADLRDQDKSKIAKLVQQVLHLGEENEQLKKRLEENEKESEKKIFDLTRQNESWCEQYETIRNKFAKSLTMVKVYQEKLVELESTFHSELDKLKLELDSERERAEIRDTTEIKTLKDQVERLTSIIIEKTAMPQTSYVRLKDSSSSPLSSPREISSVRTAANPSPPRLASPNSSQSSQFEVEYNHKERPSSPERRRQAVTASDLIDGELDRELQEMRRRSKGQQNHGSFTIHQESQLPAVKEKLSRLLFERQISSDTPLTIDPNEGSIHQISTRSDHDEFLLNFNKPKVMDEAGTILKERKGVGNEDTLFESFLREQRVRREADSGNRQSNASNAADDSELDSLDDRRDGGYLDPKDFENSQFEASLFDVIEELEKI